MAPAKYAKLGVGASSPGHWGALIGLCVGVFLLNAGWQWLATGFGYKRYFVGIELMLSLWFFVMGWRWLGGIVFVVSIVLESALAGASVLKLFNVQQLIAMAGFSLEANRNFLLIAVSASLVLASFLWMFVRWGEKVRGHYLGVLVLAVGLAQATMSFEDGNFWSPVVLPQDRLLIGSTALQLNQLLNLNAQVYELGRHDNVEYVDIKSPSAVQVVWGQEKPPHRKLLLIVAESWGMPKSDALLADQILPLSAIAGENNPLQSIRVGSIKAIGTTAMAEFRELCGKLPTKLNLHEISRERIGDCLPNRLSDRGYKTIAVHGAAMSMYDRNYSYPAFGLKKLLFLDQLASQLKARCHSFPGLCDNEVADVVRQQFEGDGPVFVYWLSLNSHLPYDDRDLTRDRSDRCRAILPENYSSALCNYHQLHIQFFEGLARILVSDAMKGADVLVVGDHAPPFYDQFSRDQFEDNQVSYVHIRVR